MENSKFDGAINTLAKVLLLTKTSEWGGEVYLDITRYENPNNCGWVSIVPHESFRCVQAWCPNPLFKNLSVYQFIEGKLHYCGGPKIGGFIFTL